LHIENPEIFSLIVQFTGTVTEKQPNNEQLLEYCSYIFLELTYIVDFSPSNHHKIAKINIVDEIMSYFGPFFTKESQ